MALGATQWEQAGALWRNPPVAVWDWPMNVTRRRPATVDGEGGLLYRVLNVNEPPSRVQMPQPRATGTRSYQLLYTSPDPVMAVTVLDDPYLEDVWTELAYEHVRQQVAQSSASRPGALYAFVDPIEAFHFASRPIIGREGGRRRCL